MCFPDFPFNTQLPSFPHHSDVLSYLHQYADQYNLHQFIQFNCHVELVTPVHSCSCSRAHFMASKENGYCVAHGETVKWTIDVVNVKTGERTSEVCDFVLLCSGYVSFIA